jgi:hypothetical protein
MWLSPTLLYTFFTIELLAKTPRASFPWYTIGGHTTNIIVDSV